MCVWVCVWMWIWIRMRIKSMAINAAAIKVILHTVVSTTTTYPVLTGLIVAHAALCFSVASLALWVQVICKNLILPQAVENKTCWNMLSHSHSKAAVGALATPTLNYMWALVLLSRSCCILYCFWEYIFVCLVLFSIFIFCLAFFPLYTEYNC